MTSDVITYREKNTTKLIFINSTNRDTQQLFDCLFDLYDSQTWFLITQIITKKKRAENKQLRNIIIK